MFMQEGIEYSFDISTTLFDFYSIIDIRASIDIDLQLFAAEDEGRTVEPTEYKKRKAREEGRVAKSIEIPSALVILFGIWTISLFGSYIMSAIRELMGLFIGNFTNIELSIGNINDLLSKIFIILAKILIPIFVAVFIIAVLSNVLQFGFLFTPKAIRFDISKITFNFKKLAERVLFSKQVIANLVKSLLKIGVLGLIVYLTIIASYDKIIGLIKHSVGISAEFIGSLTFSLMNKLAIALLLIAIPDFIFQRRQYLESLKMTPHEFKEELKEHEGDPYVKARLRQRHMEIARSRMMKEVPKADVVITNPTHFAVALRYDRFTMSAPTVIAKGMDRVAQRIKDIAKENNIVIHENKPLARELYYNVPIGSEIPAYLYEIIAQIFKMVYESREKAA